MSSRSLGIFIAAGLLLSTDAALAQTTVTIGTVNNSDMIIMQKLTPKFEEQHPDIEPDWVVLDRHPLADIGRGKPAVH